ncbi:MAG TPA: hypothetical protein VEK15_21120 [Vicinamibacteria bacterium]|nr:hypothetical protein [Vicinamibacteria bacterium]
MRINLVLVAAFLASGGIVEAHEANPSRYTYGEHVRPIFLRHCGECHRAGGIAPMSLLDYQEAVPWANAIKMQLLQQTMPPWLPVDGIGAFRHARSLTAEEIDIVIDWAVGQTPRGEVPADVEPAPEAVGANDPHLWLDPGTDVVLAEDEFEKTECVVLPTNLAESRLATAFTVQPGLPTVVRRAAVFRGSACEGSAPLATWLPDQRSVSYPEGSGTRLAAGDRLALEILYVKGWADDGKRLTDRSRLGVTFAAEVEPAKSVRIETKSYQLTDSSSLLALYPDPSQGEEPFRVDAVLPDGSSERLLFIERYEPAWREKYVLETPLWLPAGSRLEISRPTVWAEFLSTTGARSEQ